MKKPDKLNLKTEDLTTENVHKLGQLFPDILTEIQNKDGELIKTIDVEKLKELIGDFADKDSEIYQLTWAGKQNARRVATEPTTKTLRPVIADSEDFENTQNIYIEGDNLDVLKILRKSYTNSIKCIYIDPPYNTRKDFVYKDNFSMSKEDYETEAGVVNEEGNRLIKNTGTDGRFHSNWLNMMYPRLQLAYKLLTKEGVIFISIGDDEIDNLKKICNEIFGENNFVEIFIIRSNPRGNQAKKYTASEHEYVICYAKDRSQISPLGFPKSEGEYNKSDEKGVYRELGLRKRGAGARREDAPNQYYPICFNPNTDEIAIEKKTNDFVEIYPKLSDGTDGRWRWSKKSVLEKKDELLIRLVSRNGTQEYDVFQKDYFSEDKVSKIKSIIYEKEVNYENGTEELKLLFDNVKLFDYPKPVYLIKNFLSATGDNKGIILDFFSGSATTAHAVMQLNAEDNGSRKFIMVQLPEEVEEGTEAFKAGYKNICEIGKERIRRAAKKIKEDNKDKALSNIDFGFKVFKLDSSNMKDTYYNPGMIDQKTLINFKDRIKDDRNEEDLIYQVLLDMGLKLSGKIQIKTIDKKKLFVISDTFLVACFDDNISKNVLDEIIKIKPKKIVFKESCFEKDADMINVMEVIKHKVYDSNQENFNNNVRLL